MTSFLEGANLCSHVNCSLGSRNKQEMALAQVYVSDLIMALEKIDQMWWNKSIKHKR